MTLETTATTAAPLPHSRFISWRALESIALAVLLIVATTIWLTRLPAEPAFGGKRISAWLDEVQKLDYREQSRAENIPVKAVRAIGTNAIPWLLNELHANGSVWHWRMNQLLEKQSFIKLRFPDVNKRLGRATVGFRALGELGSPAIPDLLKLVDTQVGYAPGALACIGVPAIPALQQCLTNTMQISTSAGALMPCPGNTIGSLQNECLNFGHIPLSEIAILVPTIRMWGMQSSNSQAAWYATNFLKAYEQRISELGTNGGGSSPR